MRYAVVYQSKSGNTEKIAERIFDSIWTSDKILVDIDLDYCYQQADVYFIGFAIHDGSCSMDIINFLENLPNAQYAFFATCGLNPTDEYKKKLQRNLDAWLPDNGEYLGMFLCQGCIEEFRREIWLGKMPTQEKQLVELFENGSSHPDSDDLRNAENFSKIIQQMVEGF